MKLKISHFIGILIDSILSYRGIGNEIYLTSEFFTRNNIISYEPGRT